jgi:saccharopine dehydrogenase (NAD+, L-lysine-forming)
MEAGHTVIVEASETRCVPTEDYQAVGCKIVPSNSWRTDAPPNAIITGLKEIDVDDNTAPLTHRHITFGHAYKNQTGWREFLNRFIMGNGTLLDLEYLTFDNGARVAAFGRSAGFVGAGVGVLNWIFQQSGQPGLLPSLDYYNDFAHMVSVVSEKLQKLNRVPRVIVIGALGRCGRGAVSLCEQVGITPTKWDINETQGGGPFLEILEHDILVNCIYLSQKIPPFITTDLLHKEGRVLSTVVDVSCDYTNPHNPIPIYNVATTFPHPTVRIIEGSHPVDVVSIDHLPSLVPLESSKEFADALIPHLIACDGSDVWKRCRQIFVDKTEPLRQELKAKLQHIWLRDETLDNERRTPLTPEDAKKLIEQGFVVHVERSSRRIFSDEEYENVGCQMVASGSWKDAPVTTTILGKEM